MGHDPRSGCVHPLNVGVYLRQGQRQGFVLLLGRVLTMDLTEFLDTTARKVHCALIRHDWDITKRIKLGNLVIAPGVRCKRCGKDKTLKPLPAGHPEATALPLTSDQAAWLKDVDDAYFPAEVG